MGSSDQIIQAGSRLRLHFSLALQSGDIIDSNFAGSPASFCLGDGNMLPGFEAVLLGHRAGDLLEQLIPAEQAFGHSNPDNCQHFALAKFRHLLDDKLMPVEEGSVVSFQDAGGFALPGVVKAIDNETVTVDFNHPLAGKAIIFKAKILSVLAPDEQPIEIS